VRRTGEKNVHKSPPDFKIGKAIMTKDGSDVTLIACGWIINNVIKAAELLAKDGFNARIISMHTIRPLDTEMLTRCAKETGAIVTVEDHITSGLGSRVAMTLASSPQRATPFMSLGLKEGYSYDVGSEDYHLNKANLLPEGIHQSVVQLLR
jgi:transketolase